MILFIHPSVRRFFAALPEDSAGNVQYLLDILSGLKTDTENLDIKKIDRSLFEARFVGLVQLRIIYAYHDSVLCILHAFIKKRWKIAKKDIDTAYQRLRFVIANI